MSDYSSADLKRAALAAMRKLAEQEPEGWNKDTQLRALEAAEAGDLDDQWPKSEATIRVFLANLPRSGGGDVVELREALVPLASAATKREAMSGNSLSDKTRTVVPLGHLRAARAALSRIEAK